VVLPSDEGVKAFHMRYSKQPASVGLGEGLDVRGLPLGERTSVRVFAAVPDCSYF
jgi:hypothetical protein